MGTCARIFPYEVQFGHAGASGRYSFYFYNFINLFI